GAQNAYNPLPNGNGVPVAPVNTTAANPPPPPPPPPQPEPEKNLVVDWNGPGGSFSGYGLDEHFPFA
ncbi:hypothetical protein FS842_008771, partial [Serendipita sp. 407]